jgi:hypothetical protein
MIPKQCLKLDSKPKKPRIIWFLENTFLSLSEATHLGHFQRSKEPGSGKNLNVDAAGLKRQKLKRQKLVRYLLDSPYGIFVRFKLKTIRNIYPN